jgi:hypothetical protein
LEQENRDKFNECSELSKQPHKKCVDKAGRILGEALQKYSQEAKKCRGEYIDICLENVRKKREEAIRNYDTTVTRCSDEYNKVLQECTNKYNEENDKLQKEKLKINEDCDRLFKKANDSVIECAEKKPKTCLEGYELVKGNCEPVCTGGQVRNTETGQCECPTGQTLVEGQCKEPGLIDKIKNWMKEKDLEMNTKWIKIQYPNMRSLAPDEKDLLKNGLKYSPFRDKYGLFRESINYDKIQIVRKPGSGTPETSGYVIFLPDKWKGEDIFEPDGSLTFQGKAALIHEAVHVWQNQNTDNYLVLPWKARWQEIMNLIKHGFNREPLYDWKSDAVKEPPIPFEKLGVEKQSRLIEDLAVGNLEYKGKDLTLYALDALKKLQEKKGAP